MCGGGKCSILLLRLVARCLEIYIYILSVYSPFSDRVGLNRMYMKHFKFSFYVLNLHFRP